MKELSRTALSHPEGRLPVWAGCQLDQSWHEIGREQLVLENAREDTGQNNLDPLLTGRRKLPCMPDQSAQD